MTAYRVTPFGVRSISHSTTRSYPIKTLQKVAFNPFLTLLKCIQYHTITKAALGTNAAGY